MKRFAILAAAVLTLSVMSGCGEEREEKPGDQSTVAELAADANSNASAGSIAEGGASTADAAGQGPPPITTEEELRAALKAKNPGFHGEVTVSSDGQNISVVVLNDPAIQDISPLAGLPLHALDLRGCHVIDIGPLEGMRLGVLALEETGVRDISALKGMPLVELYLNNTRVDDISPMEGAPLEKLYLPGTRVTDLGPLGEMRNLHSLWLNDTPVSDITALRKVPLVSLTLAGTRVSDLGPLDGLALKRLHIARSKVTDLSPLKWLRLQRLVFTPRKIEKGIEYVRNMITIGEIGTAFGEEGRPDDLMAPHVFWRLYDAGEFN